MFLNKSKLVKIMSNKKTPVQVITNKFVRGRRSDIRIRVKDKTYKCMLGSFLDATQEARTR